MAEQSGPLAGIRVVELAGIGPSPYGCMLLAELGADVLRVCRPDADGALNGGLDRSRPSIELDLRTASGRDLLLRLVERADVLVEGMRPGVAERLGVGPSQCQERNPRLVYARMTGWGQDGPLAARAGHDITYAALTGALSVSGPADKPMQAVNLVADFGGGGTFLVIGILAALLERQVSGQGQVVDAAMVDGASSLMTMVYAMFGRGQWREVRQANLLDGGCPFYDTYECSDGRHVAVGALEPQFYRALIDGLGLPDVDVAAQYDVATWPSLRAALTRTFATRTRDEWAAHFADTDACVAPVLSLREAPVHPHLASRGTFSTMDGSWQPSVAPRFSRTPGHSPTPARPADDDVLRSWGIGPTL